MIIINNQYYDLSTAITYNQQVMTFTTVLEQSTKGCTASTTENWLQNISETRGYSDGTNYYQSWSVTIPQNMSSALREGAITLKGEVTETLLEEPPIEVATIEITQGGSMDYYIPIWKDVYFEKMIDQIDYEIHSGDNVIYQGRALMRPDGSSGVKIDISRIAQDFINTSLPMDIRNIDTYKCCCHFSSRNDFELWFYDTKVMVYHFINDWTYNPDIEYPIDGCTLMSKPVNGHADPRMLIPYTIFNGDGYSDVDFDRNGAYWTTITWDEQIVPCSVFFNASYVGLGNEISDGSDDFKYTVGYCGDAALYYKNRQGGYDAFLIEGAGKKIDSVEKYSINRSFDNSSMEFEEYTYRSPIQSKYEFKTGWLTDSQSEIFAENLLSSNEVYLHILKEDKIIPVLITADSIEHKTYKNSGKQLVSYTINCKESQKKQLL